MSCWYFDMLKTDFPTQFWTIHFDPLIAQLRSEIIQNVNVDLFTQASELFWLKGKKLPASYMLICTAIPEKHWLHDSFPMELFLKKYSWSQY